MKAIVLFFTLFALLFSLPSCSPIYYEPSTHNVPMFEKQGDFNIGGSANLVLNKGEVQGSYAVSNHVGVMANYMIKKYHLDTGAADTRLSQMFESGVGYFNNFNDRLVFEAYGLIGKGSFDNRITNFGGTETLSGNMTKYVLQLSLGYREKGFELAYSMRPTQLRFHNLIGNLSYGGRDQLELLTVKDKYVSVEHAITARFGHEFMKFQMQLGRGGRQFARGNNRLKSYLTLGIAININEYAKSDSTSSK